MQVMPAGPPLLGYAMTEAKTEACQCSECRPPDAATDVDRRRLANRLVSRLVDEGLLAPSLWKPAEDSLKTALTWEAPESKSLAIELLEKRVAELTRVRDDLQASNTKYALECQRLRRDADAVSRAQSRWTDCDPPPAKAWELPATVLDDMNVVVAYAAKWGPMVPVGEAAVRLSMWLSATTLHRLADGVVTTPPPYDPEQMKATMAGMCEALGATVPEELKPAPVSTLQPTATDVLTGLPFGVWRDVMTLTDAVEPEAAARVKSWLTTGVQTVPESRPESKRTVVDAVPSGDGRLMSPMVRKDLRHVVEFAVEAGRSVPGAYEAVQERVESVKAWLQREPVESTTRVQYPAVMSVESVSRDVGLPVEDGWYVPMSPSLRRDLKDVIAKMKDPSKVVLTGSVGRLETWLKRGADDA